MEIPFFLSGLTIRNNIPTNPDKSEIDPMIVAKVRSDIDIGCTQANIKMVIPPIPNNTFRDIARPLSLTKLLRTCFYLFNSSIKDWSLPSHKSWILE